MADRLREDSQEGIAERVLSAGTAALAIGAGAALFYRKGGNDLLSRGTGRMSRFLSGAENMMMNKPRSLDQVTGQLTDLWKESYIQDELLGVRMSTTNNLMSSLTSAKRLRPNSARTLGHQFDREMIQVPVLGELRQLLNPDKIMDDKIRRFVYSSGLLMKDPIRMERLSKRIFNESDKEIIKPHEILEKILLQTEKAMEGRGAWMDNRSAIFGQLENIARDPRELGRTFGSLDNRLPWQKVLDFITGDRAATVDDVLKNTQKFAGKSFAYTQDKGRGEVHDFVSVLQETMDKMDGPEQKAHFGRLFVDAAALRIDGAGNFRSFEQAASWASKGADAFAGSLLGNIFKARDILGITRAPSIELLVRGASDRALAGAASGSRFLGKNLWRVNGKFYEENAEGTGIAVREDLKDFYALNGEVGSMSGMLRTMFGDEGYRTGRGEIAKRLDVFGSPKQTIFEKFGSIFKKYDHDDWVGNSLNYWLRPTEMNQIKLALGDDKDIANAAGKALDINDFFARHAHSLGRSTAKKLADETRGSGESHRIFDVLSRGDDEVMEWLFRPKAASGLIDPGSLLNKDLAASMNRLTKDQIREADRLQLKAPRLDFWADNSANESVSKMSELRTELAKEAFLRYGRENGGNADLVATLSRRAGLSGQKLKEADRLSAWTLFQQHTEISSKRSELAQDVSDTVTKTRELFKTGDGPSQELRAHIQNTLKQLEKERVLPWEDALLENENIVAGEHYRGSIHIKKMYGGKSILRDLNNGIKASAIAKRFAGQFVAGRNNPQDVTTATLIPYFYGYRLNEGMNMVGLGFSQDSMGSPYDLWRNIVLKRALPAAVAYGYMDYANDSQRFLTGQSTYGSMLAGAANLDLAWRKFGDATGLTGFLKDEKKLNPIFQYWSDKEPYQNAEERREYYRNGYDPVRKGAHWWFGSANEWRGGKIDYYLPNSLRMSTANPKDEQLYNGSMITKWSHSWLPTPTNPLSPLFAAADPYWLENMHSEDRPYPVTGPLFERNTPWGLVLNPTIGEIIKPQRRMHQDRLGNNFVDVKGITERLNRATIAKANDRKGYIRVHGATLEAADYVGAAAPTEGERNPEMEIRGGQITGISAPGYGQYDGYAVDAAAYGEMDQQQRLGATGIGMEERLEIQALGGSQVAGYAGNFIRNWRRGSIVGQLNEQTKQRARPIGAWNPERRPSMSPMFTTPWAALQGDDLDDMRDLSSGMDFARESALTWRYLSGLHGWMAGSMLGIGAGGGRRLAEASDMTTYTRDFWDSGIGGMGDDVMEITRRFIPTYRRRERFNPLRNTMPDWIPERFRYGDPFTSLPSGEARMPGRGFEKLNGLHPDQFGKYGAFDRFKILADVAPGSPEYKIWKQLASATVGDKSLRKEMKDIRHRVSLQKKTHDFYDYKFIGRGLEHQSATISQVLDNNHFKVMGDDQNTYRVSGVRIKSDAQGNPTLQKHLHPGMVVNLAMDENPAYRKDADRFNSVNAAVFIDGENLGDQLLEQGLAVERKGDTSSAAVLARHGFFRRAMGTAIEGFAHLDLPFFHDKLLRVRTPLESYRSEQVYGTGFQSWTHPIDSFLMPALNRMSANGGEVAMGAIAMEVHRRVYNSGAGGIARRAADVGLMLGNRGAFIGATLGLLWKTAGGTGMMRAARIGGYAQMAGYIYTRSDQPAMATVASGISGAYAGFRLGMHYGAKDGGLKGAMIGGAVGAGAGLLIASQGKALFSNQREVWTPDRTRRKWELQELFDRLNYIKYTALYEKAADKAKSEEDVNVRELIGNHKKDWEAKKALRDEIERAKIRIKNELPDTATRSNMLETLNSKLRNLETAELVMRGGEYTRSALLYHQLAGATVYGMDENTSWVDAVRALPKNERDYFLEMAKEKDAEKRQEILKNVSPLLNRALRTAWRDKSLEEKESNESFFSRHSLPGPFWAGWRPDTDLADVQVKTIYNEGMLLGDFNMYETQLTSPKVVAAPNLPLRGGGDPLTTRLSLEATLSGLGLTGVEVSVEPKAEGGIELMADVYRSTTYDVEQKVKSLLSYL